MMRDLWLIQYNKKNLDLKAQMKKAKKTKQKKQAKLDQTHQNIQK